MKKLIVYSNVLYIFFVYSQYILAHGISPSCLRLFEYNIGMKKKVEKNTSQNIVLFTSPQGEIQFRGDFKHETIWATQAQIAEVFGVTPQNITMHIKNIFKDKELEEKSTCKDSLQVQKEGDRMIQRKVKEYNLDIIIAVGYRISSVAGTKFRQWATKTLKSYITKGYALNKKQLKKNHVEFLKAVESIQNLLPENTLLDSKALLDLVKEFSSTWTYLDAYDKESLQNIASTKRSLKLSGEELYSAVADLRVVLVKKGEATEIFAQERERGSLEGILGNVMQSFGGSALYPSLEEKAAHLLYFIIKNHPFVDGNKRSAAWAFLWFLKKARVKGVRNINPEALTAITLLIAESKPEKKDQMTALVTNFLSMKKR